MLALEYTIENEMRDIYEDGFSNGFNNGFSNGQVLTKKYFNFS